MSDPVPLHCDRCRETVFALTHLVDGKYACDACMLKLLIAAANRILNSAHVGTESDIGNATD